MLHRIPHLFGGVRRRYAHCTLRCLLGMLACDGLYLCVPMQASEEARRPLVILGNLSSRKNYTAAALLGTEFTWFKNNRLDELMLRAGKQAMIEGKFSKRLLDLDYSPFTQKEETTIVYDHPDLAYPLHNVRGFGKRGLNHFSATSADTKAAHASFQKIIKQPMQGLLLHVHLMHIKKRHHCPSLDVMDFLLPYFKDAEAIQKYLAPSVSLVITGFGAARNIALCVYDVTPAVRQRGIATYALRQSMQVCYTRFYKAKQGTQAYARLAKQKAFYDIFIKNAASIKPRGGRFFVDDFHLNLDKIIFFDPCDSVPVGQTDKANTSVLEAAVDKFEGIPAAALVYSDGVGYWLWAVPFVGASAYAWSGSQDSTEGKDKTTQRSRASRTSVRGDDDDIDDPMLASVTSTSTST